MRSSSGSRSGSFAASAALAACFGRAADPGLEVRPELIKDLDVTVDDADNVAGGSIGRGGQSFAPGQGQ